MAHKPLCSWTSAIALLALLAPAAQAARYTIVDLGPSLLPNAVNASSDVAAQTYGWQAEVYRHGRWHMLGDTDSFAYDLNAQGDVVGNSHGSATVWLRGQGGRRIAFLLGSPGFQAYAYAINGSRLVVGTYSAGYSIHPLCFAWSPELGLRELTGFVKNELCWAAAVNSAGQIVGGAIQVGGAEHAFLYEAGVYTDLGTLPGGAGSAAAAINERGDICGVSTIPAWPEDRQHAVAWHDGTIVDLDPAGAYRRSGATALNDTGVVVGWGDDDRVIHAVRFGPGRITRLEDEVVNLDDWQLEAATGVNNRGEIVGYGNRTGDLEHGFLLEPVGAP